MKTKKHRCNYRYYKAVTSDNIPLYMRRYKPRRKRKLCPFPVILCHGLYSNKHCFDLDVPDNDENLWKKYSLACYLTDDGHDMLFDVWIPELRGLRSYRHEIDMEEYWQPDRFNWCVDDYIERDMPAIVHKIQKVYLEENKYRNEAENCPPVFWVGMSMGGMIAYAYGETEHGTQNLKGVVTIGSPVAFEFNRYFWSKLLRILPPGNLSMKINVKELIEDNKLIQRFMDLLGGNSENVDKNHYRKFIYSAFDNELSLKVLKQFAFFSRFKDFCRYPSYPWITWMAHKLPLIHYVVRPYSYKKNLRYFKSPLLALAGGADKQGTIDEVKYAIAHVGSSDVTYAEFSKGSQYINDYDREYGHVDFHLGKYAKDEVYPVIYDWLVDHVEKND